MAKVLCSPKLSTGCISLSTSALGSSLAGSSLSGSLLPWLDSNSELEARIFFLLPPISLDVDGSASAAGCVNQEPLSLAARTLLLSLSNDSSLFLDFFGLGLLLGFT